MVQRFPNYALVNKIILNFDSKLYDSYKVRA